MNINPATRIHNITLIQSCKGNKPADAFLGSFDVRIPMELANGPIAAVRSFIKANA